MNAPESVRTGGLNGGLIEKLIKLCVMPCIYGRSHQSMLKIIEEHCRDRLNNFLTTRWAEGCGPG